MASFVNRQVRTNHKLLQGVQTMQMLGVTQEGSAVEVFDVCQNLRSKTVPITEIQ